MYMSLRRFGRLCLSSANVLGRQASAGSGRPEGQGQARGEGATAMVDALADITGTGTPSSGAMSSPASWLPDRGSLSRCS